MVYTLIGYRPRRTSRCPGKRRVPWTNACCLLSTMSIRDGTGDRHSWLEQVLLGRSTPASARSPGSAGLGRHRAFPPWALMIRTAGCGGGALARRPEPVVEVVDFRMRALVERAVMPALPGASSANHSRSHGALGRPASVHQPSPRPYPPTACGRRRPERCAVGGHRFKWRRAGGDDCSGSL